MSKYIIVPGWITNSEGRAVYVSCDQLLMHNHLDEDDCLFGADEFDLMTAGAFGHVIIAPDSTVDYSDYNADPMARSLPGAEDWHD